MNDVIQSIYEFNQKAGLLTEYSDAREAAFLIEEALEGFDLTALKDQLFLLHEGVKNSAAKDCGRRIAYLASLNPYSIPKVDRIDKACDAIVFSVGALFKLGLTPDQVVQAMTIVTNANLTKIGSTIDKEGKLTKPETFIPPEEQLLAMLGSECSF